jgi:hypothetical protein
VRNTVFALAFGASILCPALAIAAPPTANVLFAGTIKREYLNQGASSWCMFDGTQSSFLRKTGPGVRLISFPDIILAPTGSVGPLSYTVGGLGRMTFNPGGASGRIEFVPVAGNLPGVNNPRFNAYAENYDAATGILRVSFNINFPTCTLPVAATYRN